MKIREASETDLEAVLRVEREAFGQEEESILVRNLLGDESAKPLLSLLAFQENEPAGHILFTKVTFDPPLDFSASILAPVAVRPAFQKQGIGGALITRGLERLREAKVGLVFVLGYPSYYGRFGFKPAGKLGFEAPYPIAEKNADAWMVTALRENILGSVKGKVVCADQLSKPEYWQE